MTQSEEFRAEDAKVNELCDYLKSIGLKDFAEEIWDLKHANRLAELSASIRYSELSGHLWELWEDKLLETEISVQSAIFDKSISYNSVILTLGYAGFFSIWNIVSDDLSLVANSWVGLLLGASLIVFVVWTLLSSIVLTRHIGKRAKLIQNEYETRQEMIKAFTSVHADVSKFALRMQILWPYMFSFSALTGLGAGAFLCAKLVEHVVGVEFPAMLAVIFRQVDG